MARKTFKVTGKEEGRGKPFSESFATLAEARDYIRDRWQGAEYVDGKASFHTDYCTYKCIGFTLADVGLYRATSSDQRKFADCNVEELTSLHDDAIECDDFEYADRIRAVLNQRGYKPQQAVVVSPIKYDNLPF